MSARAGFLAGLLAAVLAAGPAALRFGPGLFWHAFFVLFAGAALVMAPLASALAARGAPTRFQRALTVGALASAFPLIPFATMLKTTTHHRPLAGVTFAVVAGFVIVAFSCLSARLITWAGAQPSRLRTVARASIVVLTALGAASLLLGLVHALKGGPSYRTGIFDALRVLGLSTLAAWVPLPAWLARRGLGLGVAALIVMVTVGVCLGRAPVMKAELAEHCPVLHWPLLWLGG